LCIEQTSINKLPASIANLTSLREFTYDSELADDLPESLKEKFYHKTYFDFFLKKVKTIDLLFACQIYLKDGDFMLIENDLDMLCKVDEEQIFYFNGVIQDYEDNWDTGDDFPKYLDFIEVDSRSQKYFTGGCYSTDITEFSTGADNNPMNTYRIFSIIALYDLIEEGISFETVETLIPKLYQHYDTVLKPYKESHRVFLEEWEHDINDFYVNQGLRKY
jgi:hypothetical protein